MTIMNYECLYIASRNYCNQSQLCERPHRPRPAKVRYLAAEPRRTCEHLVKHNH